MYIYFLRKVRRVQEFKSVSLGSNRLIESKFELLTSREKAFTRFCLMVSGNERFYIFRVSFMQSIPLVTSFKKT